MTKIIGCAPNNAYIILPVILNMSLNIIFIILDFFKIFNKSNKSTITSLEKFLVPLSVIDFFVSFFWCISGFLPYEKIHENSAVCKTIGCFHIFFYIFEVLLIHQIISHLKHLILIPLNYILKSGKQLLKTILICTGISLFISLFSFFLDIIGKSPMNSCFFKHEIVTETEDSIFKLVVLVIILFFPYFIFIFSLYTIIIVLISNQYENDNENKILFKSHIIYLFLYTLTFLLWPIIYFIYALKKTNDGLDNTTFVLTLFIVILPLIIGIYRLYKDKINPHSNKNKNILNLGSDKTLGLIDLEGNLDENSEKEQFENSAIKKFVMNFYISVCFCLEKNYMSSFLTYKELNKKDINTTNKYLISLEVIAKELPAGELIKDVMVKSREKFSIACEEFAPKIFYYLRQLDKVSDEMIVSSMLPMNNKIGIKETEGKGGSFFINSDDYEFSLKTITEQEFKMMMKLLQNNMVDYFRKNNYSIICRIYGVYKLSIQTGLYNNDEIYFILMKNVIGSFYDNLLCKYDLKGSSLNRKVQFENVDTKVLKDINFNEVEEVFLLNKSDSKKLLQIAEKDAEFLSSLGIMDYSLLVAKISLNNEEIACLFGGGHRRTTERQFLQMIGQERISISQNISEENEPNNDKNNNNNKEEDKNLLDKQNEIRFKEGNIAPLKKYMFPSLKGDIVYIMAIIDFFQIYNLQKNLETKYKKFKSGVRKEEISSLPPDEYKNRFIEFLKQKTDSEDYLKRIYDPMNKNDF